MSTSEVLANLTADPIAEVVHLEHPDPIRAISFSVEHFAVHARTIAATHSVDLSSRSQRARWMQAKGLILLILLICVGFGFGYFYKRSRPLRQFLDKLSLQIPVIAPILKKGAIARFARTLATMFGACVPLVEAMKSVAGATGNIVYQDAVMRMRDEIATGLRMQRAMENTGLFPNMVVQMIAVGKESGSLDAVLCKVAAFFEAEVDEAVKSLFSLMEPLIMVFLGGLIDGLVVAMYLPIFKLGSVVG